MLSFLSLQLLLPAARRVLPAVRGAAKVCCSLGLGIRNRLLLCQLSFSQGLAPSRLSGTAPGRRSRRCAGVAARQGFC